MDVDLENLEIISSPLPDVIIPEFLKRILEPRLPYSLPLYRRCQFHLHKLSEIKTGEIWVASVAYGQVRSSSSLKNRDVLDVIQQHSSIPWIAAHIDLTNAGQTQVWTYASWESEFSSTQNPLQQILSSPSLPVYRALLDRLFHYLRSNHIPNLSSTPSEQWQRLRDTGKIVSTPYSRSKVLFGTLAETLWPFIDDSDLVRGEGSANDSSSTYPSAISREDRPYLKYIIKLPPTSSTPDTKSSTVGIPSGFRVQSMSQSHLQTVIDRTVIPRTIETLRQLPSVALYDNTTDEPVAWGLLGKDGSLSSLHTEPGYRGRGFAEVICRKLWAEQSRFFGSSGEAACEYGHADVSDNNAASKRVLEKLGAEVMWRVGWVEVEIGTQTANSRQGENA